MKAPFDVFLSHNSKDKPTVRQLAEALQRRGLKVWLDEWELVPGRPFQRALEEIIQTTRSAAVLVGKDGLGPWEIPEMEGCLSEFVSRKLPVIPVLLPDAPSQPNLPLFLKGFTWVDLRAGGLSDVNLDRLEWGITGQKPLFKAITESPPYPHEISFTPIAVVLILVIAVVRLFMTQQLPLISKPTEISTVTKQESTSLPANLPPKPLPVERQEFQDKLKDGTLGPKMVVIPAGTFLMGSPPDEPGRGKNERQHEVEINPFAIGKYEVTFDEYDRFAEATGREKPADEGWGRGRQPVINVSWYDAVAYAEWLSAQTDQQYRLPTEAEWEYAARAGTQTAYWWGNKIGNNNANCNSCASFREASLSRNARTVPVGSFPANPFKLHDTSGNVWEWTCSEYSKDYDGQELICMANPNSEVPRACRGGAWSYSPRGVRVAYRSKVAPYNRDSTLGFRLAKNL